MTYVLETGALAGSETRTPCPTSAHPLVQATARWPGGGNEHDVLEYRTRLLKADREDLLVPLDQIRGDAIFKAHEREDLVLPYPTTLLMSCGHGLRASPGTSIGTGLGCGS